jgi:predicted esterase
MNRLGLVLAVVAATFASSPTAAVADQATFPGSLDLTVGPLISGTASYLSGTYAWTGYAYNDRGPNTSSTPGGGATYPASIPRGNAANLIQLQLSFTASHDLQIRAILETLTDPSLPVLGVGFDTDGNPGTGAATVPGGGWTVDKPIGLDAFVIVSSHGAELLRFSGGKWTHAASFGSNVQPSSNSITTVVPRSELDPGSASWRTVAALGLASWVDGSGPIYNLGFVKAEDPSSKDGDNVWQDQLQGDILSGKAPASGAVGVIDFGKIAHRLTELASASGSGYHTLLYYSHLNLGEGVASIATRGFESLQHSDVDYLGPYQPYLIHVPSGLTGPAPAIIWLHGRGGNHLQGAHVSFSGFLPSSAILVQPLGRGPNTGFGGTDIFGFDNDLTVYGEQDVLDVLHNVLSRMSIDRHRVLLSGLSMGAIGAFHMAEYFPDQFDGLLSIVGGDYGIPPINHLRPGQLENLTNLPVRMANGGIDPLANQAAAEDTVQAMDHLGDIDYRAWVVLRRQHEWMNGIVDCVFQDMATHPRVADPARVVYSINPNFEFDNPTTGLHVVHTGAYWVSGLEPRDPGARNPTVDGLEADHSATSSIDVTSLARADRAVRGAPVAGQGENVTAGADFCGPNPAVLTNDAWVMRGRALGAGSPQPVSNAMTMTMTRLSAATLDLSRMSISTAEPVSVSVTGDGPSTLTLRGPWPNGGVVDVTRDGVRIGSARVDDGFIRLADNFSGTRLYVLSSVTATPRGPLPQRRPALPNTSRQVDLAIGPTLAGAFLAGAAALGLVWFRRRRPRS